MGHPFAFIAERNALLPLVHFIEGMTNHTLYEVHKPAASARYLTPIIFGARTLDE
jgi:hypothetical protein